MAGCTVEKVKATEVGLLNQFRKEYKHVMVYKICALIISCLFNQVFRYRPINNVKMVLKNDVYNYLFIYIYYY